MEVAASSAGPLRYTLDNPRLTFEQRKFYEDNGYLLFKKLIDEDFLDECRQRFVDLCDGRVSKGGMVLMRDISLAKQGGASGERLYNKLQDFIWDDVLSRYLLAPEVLDIAECMTGPNIMAVHTMLINKPPDSGHLTSRHPMHQDLHYFPFRPANRIVASWTAMEDIHERNGCLFVVPGSHRAGELYQHDYPDWEGGVNKAFHGVRGFDDFPKKMLTMAKGDTVFFHPLLLHGSGANLTKGFRKAISGHFAASECHYVDVRGTVQEGIAKEVEEMGQMRNMNISFQDAWRIRSRCVRGRESTMSMEPTLRSRY
ncbi:phytanoyl-CoA dioxygenase, peroxisomal-like [Frankliniella occidentalis]|uniref:phytanoyl-CoA dioxygenase n=1 Tax=Frankliniella occidentalis TaxID=133901 RepID=A0A6J1SGZ0_FRAOC|nr:phytanoyl-CoA dioxygenase, peroxisomal-like [Frankliniella occidentalis]